VVPVRGNHGLASLDLRVPGREVITDTT
jgi:hypothetical protein